MTPDELFNTVLEAMIDADDYYVSHNQARAIIAVVLEEAAKVADDEGGYCEDTGSAPSDFGNAGRNDAARNIAAAIRALIATPLD